jgi:hypothetical protein
MIAPVYVRNAMAEIIGHLRASASGAFIPSDLKPSPSHRPSMSVSRGRSSISIACRHERFVGSDQAAAHGELSAKGKPGMTDRRGDELRHRLCHSYPEQNMVVVAALVGTKDLGQQVYIALGHASAGLGLTSGLAIALVAMVADRIIRDW